MTLNTLILNTAVLAIAAMPAVANSNGNAQTASHLEHILTEAKKTHAEAREISTMLRGKNPDYESVRTKMDVLVGHASSMNRLVEEFESTVPSLTSAQRAQFAKVKDLTQLVNVFVTNKTHLLTTGADRGLLRAKAEGIAKRAEMLHAAALRMRS